MRLMMDLKTWTIPGRWCDNWLYDWAFILINYICYGKSQHNIQQVWTVITFGSPNNIIYLTLSARKQAQEEREKLHIKLQEAFDNIKTLKGLLPICANCKDIRDDKGYWNQIEAYIRDRSDAEFSHSICPDCAKKLYPELELKAEWNECTGFHSSSLMIYERRGLTWTTQFSIYQGGLIFSFNIFFQDCILAIRNPHSDRIIDSGYEYTIHRTVPKF